MFILYLIFAFLNINSVIRMVIWWNLSTHVFFVIILMFVCSFCSFYCIFIITAIMWHSWVLYSYRACSSVYLLRELWSIIRLFRPCLQYCAYSTIFLALPIFLLDIYTLSPILILCSALAGANLPMSFEYSRYVFEPFSTWLWMIPLLLGSIVEYKVFVHRGCCTLSWSSMLGLCSNYSSSWFEIICPYYL
jgi:hypothetical protein